MAERKSGDRERRPGRRVKHPTAPAASSGGDDEGSDNFSDLAERTIARQDNVAQVARTLAERNKAREQRDQWKQRYEALAAELPENSIVLVGDEADAYEKLIENKVDFPKLPTLLQTLEDDKAKLTVRVQESDAKALHAEFAQTSGYNADAIGGVLKGERLHAEMGTRTVQTKEGNKTVSKQEKTLMVRPAADPKAAPVPFDEYVETKAAWYWPALRAKPANGTSGTTTTTAAGTTPATTVEQPGSGTALPENPVAAFRQAEAKRRAAQRSPLDFGAAAAVATTQQGGRKAVQSGR